MGFRMLALLPSTLAAMAVGGAAAQQHAPEPVRPMPEARMVFRVCNQTGGEIEVAKALNTGATDRRSRNIISEGWYKLAGGTCLFLWPGKLEYQHYLVYAQNKATEREWTGKAPICVSRDAFTIRSDTCGEQYYRRMFFEVNTGGEPNLFTYDFRPGN